MTADIVFPFKTPDEKGRQTAVKLPYFLYLQLVQSREFEQILPGKMRDQLLKAKEVFFAKNGFLSEDNLSDYRGSPYVNFLLGRPLHAFLGHLFAQGYQDHHYLLSVKAGSFSEFFADLQWFWSKKYVQQAEQISEGSLRDVVFIFSVIYSRHAEVTRTQILEAEVKAYAKDILAQKDQQIADLKTQVRQLEKDNADQQQALDAYRQRDEDRVVVIPGDPHHMLGLSERASVDKVTQTSKALLKILHPDRSGDDVSGYLFDMVVKARDQILKGA